MKDYYKILGVSRNASQEEIRVAYIQLAKKYHPDKNTSTDTTVHMQLILEAYRILKDIEKRKKYDIEYDKFGFVFKQATTANQQQREAKKTEAKIKVCYYCNTHIANQQFSRTETFYKETGRSYFPQSKVYYKSIDIEIPRCEECYKIHRSSALILVWLPIVSFIILGAILGSTIWSTTPILGLVIAGGTFGGILGYSFYSIDELIVAKEAGVKKESNIDDFEPVIILTKEGWSTSQPSA